MTRCCVCGRFMSDDDVLLGMSRDLDAVGQEYAHAECATPTNKNKPPDQAGQGE